MRETVEPSQYFPEVLNPISLLLVALGNIRQRIYVFAGLSGSQAVSRVRQLRSFSVLAALLQLFETGSSSAPLGIFTAEGTVSTKIYLKEGASPDITTQINFTFYYSNGWWQIINHHIADFMFGAVNKDAEGTILNCSRIPDGIRYFSTKRDQSQQHKTAQSEFKPAVAAYVEAILFPPPEMPEPYICWLALCPSPDLPFLKGEFIRRPLSKQLANEPGNKGTYSIHYLPGGFVSSLSITNDGKLYLPDNRSLQLDAPFESGYREFTFETVETANIQGKVYPMAAVLTKYLPKNEPSSTDGLRVSLRSELRVSRIHSNFATNSLSDLPSRLLAVDNRFGSTEVNYVVINDQWLAATNVQLRQLAGFAKQTALQTAASVSGRGKAVVIAALVLATGVPLCFALLRVQKTNKNRINQE